MSIYPPLLILLFIIITSNQYTYKVAYISIVAYFVFVHSLSSTASRQNLFPSIRTNILDEVT